jgi:hypothetical protein
VVVANEAGYLFVALDPAENSLTDHGMLLHLPPLVSSEWAILFKD